MANPIYQNLVELQSLDNQIKKHLDRCEEEKPRIAHIEKLRARRESELHEAEAKSQTIRLRERELEKALHDLATKLEQNKDHQMRAKSSEQVSALEREYKLFHEQQQAFENEQFTLLEISEELDAQIEAAKIFLQGSSETLQETKAEIDAVCAGEMKEVETYEKRRAVLLAELPTDFRQSFETALKRHRFSKPLSFITERRCGHCHFQLDSMLASEVFTGKSPGQCPNCDRLLIDREQI